jgi:hypothetical protein
VLQLQTAKQVMKLALALGVQQWALCIHSSKVSEAMSTDFLTIMQLHPFTVRDYPAAFAAQ